MHQRMIHELTLVRPQASGAALKIVDQTIPVVQAHLANARAILSQVGGGMNNGESGSNGGGSSGRTNP